jgi:hypothetical protein
MKVETNTKIAVGEECYTVYKKPKTYKCPVCQGTGSYIYNSFTLSCPRCNAKGQIIVPKQFDYGVCKVLVRRINISIWKDLLTVKYKVVPIDSPNIYASKVKSKDEKELFTTEYEAMEYCQKMNNDINIEN